MSSKPFKKMVNVYFIQRGAENGPIKIGGTQGMVRMRLNGLQNGSPERLRLLGQLRARETSVQSMFEKHRISGEWFRPHREVLEFVRTSTVKPKVRRKRPMPTVRITSCVSKRMIEQILAEQNRIAEDVGIKPSVNRVVQLLIHRGLEVMTRGYR